MSGTVDRGPARSRRPPDLAGLVPVPTYRDRPATPSSDIAGVDLAGDPRTVPVVATGRWSLLLFLSSGCDGCVGLWDALGDPVASGLVSTETAVAVTRDPDEEDVASLSALAPPSACVVLSTAAWAAYRVQGAPFFALVDGRAPGSSTVATEGVAWGVSQIAADVRRARGRT